MSEVKSPYETFVGHDGKCFRFTVSDNGILTRSQREFYEKNGFLVVPQLIPHELIDECRQRFLDIVNGVVDSGQILKMKDLSLKDRTGLPNERIYNKIQDFCWDPVLARYILHPALLDLVACFTGPNIRACHSMLINKPPDAGTATSRHPLHQDQTCKRCLTMMRNNSTIVGLLQEIATLKYLSAKQTYIS